MATVLAGDSYLQVLTPCGVVQQLCSAQMGLLRLEGSFQQEYLRQVSGLPQGMPILFRVESALGSEFSPWTLVRLL